MKLHDPATLCGCVAVGVAECRGWGDTRAFADGKNVPRDPD